MPRVLILTLLFPPDGVSTAQIMGDLAEDLGRSGHDVTVLTTTPHYNRDLDAERRQPLSAYWGRLVQRSTFEETRSTTRPCHGRTGQSCSSHGLGTLPHSESCRGDRHHPAGRCHCFPSPPLTMGIVAWLLGLWHRAPFIYNVQEIYPDIAINLGAIRQPWVIRVLFALERFVYARSARVTVIADRMRHRLVQKGVAESKIQLIPNFVDADALQPVPRPNEFSRRFELENSFVVSYAGNFGPAQGLETLLDAAARLRDLPEVVIVLVGNGILWNPLSRRISDDRLDNVRLIPYQPFAIVPMIYGASDICVVSQAVSTGTDAVPSKVYRIMSCRRPVLAATDPASDLAQLVRQADCGMVVPQESAAQIAAAIRGAYGDQPRWRAMGERGRQHVLDHYTRQVVTTRYHQLILELAVRAGT